MGKRRLATTGSMQRGSVFSRRLGGARDEAAMSLRGHAFSECDWARTPQDVLMPIVLTQAQQPETAEKTPPPVKPPVLSNEKM